jgi:hypothetical protein
MMPAMPSFERAAELIAVDRALSLIGTGPELRFDRVVGLIARYFDMTFGMVALVDGNRIWYKSRYGFAAAESELPGSFTERVVNTEEPHWVTNALEDPILQHSPWVNGERDRMLSYIGYPLRSSDGAVIGCLALMDRSTREFTTNHLVQLGLVALWIQDEMTRETESERAAKVQRALLPTRNVAVPGFEVVGASAPARSVSGDFFDWREVEDGLIFSIADVMGKGVAAAIIAATVRAVLRTADEAWGIDAAVARAAGLLDEDLSSSGSFVTVLHCRLHVSESRIDYVDAGHGLTLHILADGSWNRLAHDDLPLGTGLGSTWGLQSVVLAPGDTFVSFSDGVLDIFDGSLDSMEHIADFFAESDSAEVAVDAMYDLAKSTVGNDDVTVVAVRRSLE